MKMKDTHGVEYDVTLERDAIEKPFFMMTPRERMCGYRIHDPGPWRAYTACGREVRIDTTAQKLFVKLESGERELVEG